MQLSERVVNTETLFTAAQTRAVPSRATSFRISPPRPPGARLGVAFDNRDPQPALRGDRECRLPGASEARR